MKNKARNEFLEVIAGLLMIITGVALFMSNTTVTSAFLESGGSWKWWKIILVLLPLAVGIVMLLFKPVMKAAKIVAAVGAILIIVVILVNTTIIIEKHISKLQWLACGILVIGGFAIIVAALFLKKKKVD